MKTVKVYPLEAGPGDGATEWLDAASALEFDEQIRIELHAERHATKRGSAGRHACVSNGDHEIRPRRMAVDARTFDAVAHIGS